MYCRWCKSLLELNCEIVRSFDASSKKKAMTNSYVQYLNNQIHIRFMGTKVLYEPCMPVHEWVIEHLSGTFHVITSSHSWWGGSIQEPAILLARLQACLTSHCPACNAKYLAACIFNGIISSWGKICSLQDLLVTREICWQVLYGEAVECSMPIEVCTSSHHFRLCSECNLVRTWNQNFVIEYPFMYWNIRYQCYMNSSHFNSGVLSFCHFQDSGCVCSRATMNQGAPDNIFTSGDEYVSEYAWEVWNSLWLQWRSTNPFLSEHLRRTGRRWWVAVGRRHYLSFAPAGA